MKIILSIKIIKLANYQSFALQISQKILVNALQFEYKYLSQKRKFIKIYKVENIGLLLYYNIYNILKLKCDERIIF